MGDFVIYYEPRHSTTNLSSRGGRQVYFAVARVGGITADPERADHYYATVVDFLEFDRGVSFREDGRYYESMFGSGGRRYQQGWTSPPGLSGDVKN